MKEKGAEPKRPPLGRRKLRRQSAASSCANLTFASQVSGEQIAFSPPNDVGRSVPITAASPAGTESTTSTSDLLTPLESQWLHVLYRDGYDAVFGSWMGRDGCPFL